MEDNKFLIKCSNEMNNICRACLCSIEEPSFLFDNINILNSTILLADLISTCANIQPQKSDGLPNAICQNCKENAINSYKFRLLCDKSQEKLESIRLMIPIKTSKRDKIDDSSSNESKPNPILKNKSKSDITNNNQFQFENDVKRRTCPRCGKLFQYRGSMLKHYKKHNAPPKTCKYCNFQPSSPSKLTEHKELVHSHLKNIVCITCGKTFFSESNLKVHMIVHSGIRKHTCEICGISFALSGNLAAHRRVHTGEKPFACSECGKGFTQQSALRSHEAGHSNRRDHICPECGAAFSRSGALQNHRKRHSGLKPFICTMCGKDFTFSSERKRHMITHTGDKKHVCELCGRRFNRSSNLKVHRRIHTGETPYICQVCGKGFIQAHCLRTHLNTHTIP